MGYLPHCPPQAPPLDPGRWKIFRGIICRNDQWECDQKVFKSGCYCYLPSAGGRGLRRREVRKRVRALKLQLFWTFPGLVASGTFSWLGEWRTPEPGGSGDALFRMVWDDRELFILIRSRKPILLLTVKIKKSNICGHNILFGIMIGTVFFFIDHNVHAIDLNRKLSCVILGALGSSRGAAWAC